jgi:chromosome segregation ATPase
MSGGGNGVDMGHVVAMLSEVLDGQREIRGTLNEHSRVLNEHTRVLNEHSRVLNEHTRILTDHTRVLNEHTLKLDEHSRDIADLTGQVHFLRDAVTSYHASVMGHGILISELDARVRRIEHHLDLPPAA